ncbi:MAG: hypothetical protein P8Y70_14160 [Candidatus Lokiarchaeota archaeon]
MLFFGQKAASSIGESKYALLDFIESGGEVETIKITGKSLVHWDGRCLTLTKDVYEDWETKGILDLLEIAVSTLKTVRERDSDIISQFEDARMDSLLELPQVLKTIAYEINKLNPGDKIVLIPGRVNSQGYTGEWHYKEMNLLSRTIEIEGRAYKGLILDPNDDFRQFDAKWDSFLKILLQYQSTFFTYIGNPEKVGEKYIFSKRNYKEGFVFDIFSGIHEPWLLLFTERLSVTESILPLPPKRDAFIGPEDLLIINEDDDYLETLSKLQEILERLSEQAIV